MQPDLLTIAARGLAEAALHDVGVGGMPDGTGHRLPLLLPDGEHPHHGAYDHLTPWQVACVEAVTGPQTWPSMANPATARARLRAWAINQLRKDAA